MTTLVTMADNGEMELAAVILMITAWMHIPIQEQ